MNYCKLTINGQCLDNILPGYTTTNVEGRGLFVREYTKTTIDGRDGAYIKKGTYPPRELKVHYVMVAADHNQWLRKMRKLNEILNTEIDVPISFADEEGTRYGQVSDFTDPPYDQHEGTGTITILCGDPFIYGQEEITRDRIGSISSLHAKILQIKGNIKSATSRVIITNTQKQTRLILNGSFKAGDELIFKGDKITVNGVDRRSWLDPFESDYFEFKLYANDTVESNELQNLEIRYQSRWL